MLLKLFLKEQRITKKDFSQKIGVSPVAVSYYCSRKIKPCYKIMERIFEKTGGKVTPNDFLDLNYGENLYKVTKEANLYFSDTKNTNGKSGNKRTCVQDIQKYTEKTPNKPLVNKNLNELANQ